jgi:hypothetical protein
MRRPRQAVHRYIGGKREQRLARRKTRRRTRSENIMLVVGILVAISMVLGSFVAFFR